MKSNLDSCLLALAGTFACLSFSTGGDNQPAGDPNVLARFAVARNGDYLLVPVQLNGEQNLFAIDTGCTASTYDTALMPATEPLRTVLADTPTGKIPMKLFASPQASAGPISLETSSPVTAMDLTNIREATGHAVMGCVGMDVLRRHVVQIDVGVGELRFLQCADRRCGTPLALTFSRQRPQVAVRDIPGWGEELFVLDTGLVGQGTGTMGSPLFDGLAAKGELSLLGTTLIEAASGTAGRKLARCRQLTLGSFARPDLIFSMGRENSLGLGFLSRFVVTFDFPNKTVYLKKGLHFDRPDRRDYSGLHLDRKADQIVVHSVDRGSPAGRAGVQPGDRVLRIDDKESGEYSLYEVRELLTSEGKTVRLALRRGNAAKEVSFTLKP